MTVEQAFKYGYKIHDVKWCAGYISRKNYDEMKAEIKTAGGKRHGEKYYERPCYLSTRYFYRVYLEK